MTFYDEMTTDHDDPLQDDIEGLHDNLMHICLRLKTLERRMIRVEKKLDITKEISQ